MWAAKGADFEENMRQEQEQELNEGLALDSEDFDRRDRDRSNDRDRDRERDRDRKERRQNRYGLFENFYAWVVTLIQSLFFSFFQQTRRWRVQHALEHEE